MKVLVCGSRRFTDPFRVSLAIDARMKDLPEHTTVIHGAAIGADAIAAEAARRHGAIVHAVPVSPGEYERYGKRAPLRRNLRMLDDRPDLVIAFWDGKSTGTAHTLTEARKRGIPVEVIAA